MSAIRPRVLIYLISFISPQSLTVGGKRTASLEGKMEILSRSTITDRQTRKTSEFIPPREEAETYAIRELAAAKDIKLKVVKKISLQFQIFNLFPITFSTFSWVFFANVFFPLRPQKKPTNSELEPRQHQPLLACYKRWTHPNV
jgi:hypothetical protein